MNSLFAVFLSESLQAVIDFYVEHFDFKVVFEADWYVQLHRTRPDAPPLELAFMLPNVDALPESVRTPSTRSTGVILTLDFDDIDQIYDRLVKTGAIKEFILDPTDEAWGQRHFMFLDPSGLTVDVVQSIPPSAEYEGAYSGEES